MFVLDSWLQKWVSEVTTCFKSQYSEHRAQSTAQSIEHRAQRTEHSTEHRAQSTHHKTGHRAQSTEHGTEQKTGHITQKHTLQNTLQSI